MRSGSPLASALWTLGVSAIAAPALAFVLASAKAAIWGATLAPPHAVCWRTEPGLVWLHLFGDLAVWTAYTAIPAAVVYLLAISRSARTSLTFPGLQIAGALFVMLCGVGHLMDAAETWYSLQWSRGLVKIATAAASWAFVGMFWHHRRALAAFALALAQADGDVEPRQGGGPE